MTHFAGKPAMPGQKQVVNHHAETNAGAHIEHGKTIQVAGLAIHVLSQAQRMSIVYQHALGGEQSSYILPELLAIQEMQVGRQPNLLLSVIDQPNHTYPDT